MAHGVNSGIQSIGGGSGDNQGSSGSPDGGQSSGPTPNSSTGSGVAQDPRSVPASAQIGGSGGNSYRASPISPHQNLMPQAGDLSAHNFFGASSGFSMNDQQGNFGLSNGWDNIGAQTNMPPLGEGVMRAIMDMGPMDAMDLTSWDSTNDNGNANNNSNGNNNGG